MGNTTSAEFQEAVDEVGQQTAAPAEGPPGVKLFEFVKAASGAASWSLLTSHAAPRFYDANGDSTSARAKPEWMLEIDAADIDARADESLQYVADRGAKRVTFAAGGRLFALRFPGEEGFSDFMEKLDSHVFANTYGFEDDESGRDKVLGEFRDMFFKGGGGDIAPMEEDGAPEEEGPDPSEMREKEAASKAGTPINAMVIGANANTYLQRGSQFDVMRNVEGGVEDTGLTFNVEALTTPGGGGRTRGARGGGMGASTPTLITPGKVILAQGETRMNMISPAMADKLFHADIEYQKVVSEWAFSKDGVDVPQADIANDSKAAQLEDGTTFLGLDGALWWWALRTAGCGCTTTRPSRRPRPRSPAWASPSPPWT
ncbi:hypothetical protein Rsub_05274 [Raphidocelis subcapitata]|uniref:Uncharacterized protein n=1 Tax=Raphidocelis subcapitata TaxID=307507 RepID=A0A2V0NZT3_9CHLO|nr:hypothetical protein Rsub_05274 [Raphidocelis subcapitata]|eukprot:GBF92192.1 hypothetical protein Rsub_05274 [Raphidocelis subcapitata]